MGFLKCEALLIRRIKAEEIKIYKVTNITLFMEKEIYNGAPVGVLSDDHRLADSIEEIFPELERISRHEEEGHPMGGPLGTSCVLWLNYKGVGLHYYSRTSGRRDYAKLELFGDEGAPFGEVEKKVLSHVSPKTKK